MKMRIWTVLRICLSCMDACWCACICACICIWSARACACGMSVYTCTCGVCARMCVWCGFYTDVVSSRGMCVNVNICCVCINKSVRAHAWANVLICVCTKQFSGLGGGVGVGLSGGLGVGQGGSGGVGGPGAGGQHRKDDFGSALVSVSMYMYIYIHTYT